MRSDLNKQLCEHERHRSWDKYGNYRHRKKFKHIIDEEDDCPRRESMRIRYNTYDGRKELSENLNPLWGFIRKSVGKRWDSVYSELCKAFDKRKVVNQHILDHVSDKVAVNTFIGEDGGIYVDRNYGHPVKIENTSSYVEYYVDPRDGILKKCKRKERPKVTTVPNLYWLNDNTVVRKMEDGVWYVFDVINIVIDTFDEYARITIPPAKYKWQQNTAHINRRTASKKILRSLGL